MNRKKLNAIAERLRSLEDERGRLPLRKIVDDARSKKSPLHDQFEWDDKIAGERYRLDQARSLVRSVRVHVETDTRSYAAVCYVHDPEADTAQYVNVATLRDERQLAIEALRAEIKACNGLIARARSVAESLDLVAELEMISEAVDVLRARLEDAA